MMIREQRSVGGTRGAATAFAVLGLTLSWFVSGRGDAAELQISSDFPGGSAKVVTIDAAAGRMVIEPAAPADRGWPCWWYFRVDGAQPGQPLTLEVMASQAEYRPGTRLTANWALPQQPMISSDDVHWQPLAPGTLDEHGGRYALLAPGERFWLAWGPPFLPAHGDRLLAELADKLFPEAERFELARTRGGRPVEALRIGSPDAPGAIWVQARQHAWESGSSWVGDGWLRWIASDDPRAQQLRNSHEIYFVPIMDVDNVALGAGGKDAIPRDHNRDWADAPVYPEVAAAQRRLRELIAQGRLRVFLDLHNPAPSDHQPFFFGPLDYEQLEAEHRRRYDRFLELATEYIRGPLAIQPRYRFATYVRTDEERSRVSGNWVRSQIDQQAIALTLETAWNTPHSDIEGYRQVGRGLAQTVARFLQPDAAE